MKAAERGIALSKHDAAKKAAQQAEQAVEAVKEEKTETTPELQEDPKIEELRAQLEQAAAELAQQKDLFLRIAAEYDNYRKRTEREKTMVYTDASADTIEKFLPVGDNLERALSQPECSVEDLRKGVEMVHHQLNEILTKMGVAVIGLQGEDFNPEMHNAVSHVEDDKLGENVVAEVLQKGYRIGDRIIRHAMVQVAN